MVGFQKEFPFPGVYFQRLLLLVSGIGYVAQSSVSLIEQPLVVLYQTNGSD